MEQTYSAHREQFYRKRSAEHYYRYRLAENIGTPCSPWQMLDLWLAVNQWR